MSSGQATAKAKDTLNAVKELLEKAEESAHKAMNKAAPAVQKSLDASLEAASKGFNATMKTIGTRTEKEQLELLRAYKKFLDGQAAFVDSRITAIEQRAGSRTV
jgi:chemotaxis regulatin CheY-phosphate phosphatase CheZ